MLVDRNLAFYLLVLLTGFCLTSLAGCKRDLGECNLDGMTAEGRPIDGPAAFDIAYRVSDGLPSATRQPQSVPIALAFRLD